jgi:hypothetical protein
MFTSIDINVLNRVPNYNGHVFSHSLLESEKDENIKETWNRYTDSSFIAITAQSRSCISPRVGNNIQPLCAFL